MKPFLAILLLTIPFAACQATAPHTQNIGPATSASAISADLRDVLAELARGHEQKVQLAFYENLPWNVTAPAFHGFYVEMGKTNADLLKELQAWAKDHNVDLTYHRGTDPDSRAQTIMEARQEKTVRGDNKEDFTRDTLMQMNTDHEWEISLLQIALPMTTDAGLKAYLEKSLSAHQTASDQTRQLLKKFRP